MKVCVLGSLTRSFLGTLPAVLLLAGATPQAIAQSGGQWNKAEVVYDGWDPVDLPGSVITKSSEGDAEMLAISQISSTIESEAYTNASGSATVYQYYEHPPFFPHPGWFSVEANSLVDGYVWGDPDRSPMVWAASNAAAGAATGSSNIDGPYEDPPSLLEYSNRRDQVIVALPPEFVTSWYVTRSLSVQTVVAVEPSSLTPWGEEIVKSGIGRARAKAHLTEGYYY